MSVPPQPVVFEPIFKPKPWGGRMLATLFKKSLPGDGPIGESWEVADLPDNESRVRGGPLAGHTIGDLIDLWGADLLGDAFNADGRFPLLIKFLDARENLSVQVHPKPIDGQPESAQAGIKHEAWYVLHAEPDAAMYIGLNDSVGPDDMRAAANSPRCTELLRKRPVHTGDCFYLPSGTPHALGGGIVVAEIQTPSDVTYRLYDWDRVGLDGKPRELHIEQGLANTRFDVPEDEIIQPRKRAWLQTGPAQQVAACPRFTIASLEIPHSRSRLVSTSQLTVWIVLSGSGWFSSDNVDLHFRAGDVVVMPARSVWFNVNTSEDLNVLRVTAPGAALEDVAEGEPA